MRIIGVDGQEWDDDTGSVYPTPVSRRLGESVEAILDVEQIDDLERARRLLGPVQKSMERAGFYAYSTFNQEQRLAIASDDEEGRFDIWVEGEQYIITLWSSDPGLYMDEENQWRRRAMERLARINIPKIARGMLADHQEAMWDDEDHGVAVRLTFRLPLAHADQVGPFVRDRIPELSDLLGFIEQQLS